MPNEQVRIRLRDARPLVEWLIKDAIQECGLTIQVLPEELISNRVALTHLRAAHNLGQRKARAGRILGDAMAFNGRAEFRKLPENIQN